MDSPNGDGPDGTSIKPVSSLLSRFESMNKPQDASSKPHDPQSQPPGRPISPRPKPERLRDFKPSHEATPSTPTTPLASPWGRERPKSMALPSKTDRELAPPPKPSTRPATVAKPQPPMQPPAVTIQPPQSPPKASIATFVTTDHSPYLNPDSVSTPTTPGGGSAKLFRIPSRPHTPNPPVPAARSPQRRASPAPSPPPPRRSVELRREREAKAAPPPTPRSEKPLIPAVKPTSLPEPRGGNVSIRQDVSAEKSPFNSPPTSPEVVDDETPPELPSRPVLQSNGHTLHRSNTTGGSFDPPPVHYSVVTRRRGREDINGSLRGAVALQQQDEPPPSLPARPQAVEPSVRQVQVQAIAVTERAIRPTISAATSSAEVPGAVTGLKKIPSNPISSQQQLQRPPKTHARSKTMDMVSAKATSESHPAPTPISSTPRSTVQQLQVVAPKPKPDATHVISAYPDTSNTNRRMPFAKKGCYEILPKYDPRICDVSGEYACTSGHLTRVWSLLDGEMLMSLSHTEGVKATAVAFKPAADPRDEASKLWIGTNLGEIMEVDVATHAITVGKGNVHGRNEVTRIHRHYNELWTLDEGGTLLVWGPDADGVPNLTNNLNQTYKVPRGHSFSMVVGDELWHATGKEIRVFAPTVDGRNQFQVLVRPMVADGAGEVTAGSVVRTQLGKVFFGHSDGKISIFSTADYSCLSVVSTSTWKISALAGVGANLWAGYNTGNICVYDMGVTPWIVLKEWQAHDNPVVVMKTDLASSYTLDRLQVVTLGGDNKLKAWDGLLQDDWIEDEMKSRDIKYCEFDELKAMVFTWNAGASTPHSLRYSGGDANFFPSLLQSSDSPDIIVFGFQELVDLEDKTATAKRFLKSSKKKEGPDQEKMSHQYRAWRDFLMKTLDDCMPTDDLYYLLHTAPMVGLFTCIFVKASLRERIRNLSGAEVKRGMGGLHGNKGAVAVRFQVDDTSLCFVNCHLAAGQTQANSRHSDIAAILDASMFPVERDPDAKIDTFTGGGDGTQVLDHELCILNGDLNYRIDTMSRDTVVTAVKQHNLAKLLDRDQLLVARRRNPAFRLRAFEELPITFAPTYKYDVGTDTYDTSEKRRSPAWCDRVLFRGRGRVQQLDYKRHEVRVSDHRPVTGNFRLWVKRIDQRERAAAWTESQQGFEVVRRQEVAEEKLYYLMHICGYDEATSQRLANERASRKPHRSPSRSREGH